MALTAGTRLGSYEIAALIGAGGMGEVYRARDTKLNRDVALKILPETLAADADRLARFRREAQLLASLNHPHIAAIYGFEDSSSTHALVMELVEGPTLADRIAQGPIAVSDALPIARQIAEALEAAHEQGIVHRDLKPANVKVRDDGTVKVLDFGLAKALAPDGSSAAADAAHSPTLTARATQLGLILGTAAYMAPEQAKGRAVDRRADIWAFGAVLYEMVTGRRLFDAEDVSETLAAVLTRDVGVMNLPSAMPARLRALLRDCLVRDPKQRLRDIGDARILLDKIMAGAPDDLTPATPAPVARGWRALVWPSVAFASLVAAAVFASRLFLQSASVADPVRFTVGAPAGVSLLGQRISPDGRKVALFGVQGAKAQVWVHSLGTGTPQAMPGTGEEWTGTFAWSSDSTEYILSTDGKLRKASAQGGPSQVIASLQAGRSYSGSWGSRGVILLGFTSNSGGPLLRVPDSGGDLVPATELDPAKHELGHRAPNFLPDGRHFFFLATGRDAQDRAAYVGSLDSKDRRPLPGITSEARYSPSGHILFIRDGTLMAQPFDVSRLEASGVAFPVVESIAAPTAVTASYFISDTGTLAYRLIGTRTSQLAWFDRGGKQLGPAGPEGEYGDIELSLDEKYVAYESGAPGDIWVLDLHNGVTQKVTSAPLREADPVWSPDGKTIAFRSDGAGGQLYSRAFGVVGEDKPVFKTQTRDSPASWSRDGKFLAFETQGSIFALPMVGDPKPIPITESSKGISTTGSQISPDGHWIAYHSSELGPSDVFIQSFPQPGAKQRVSPTGGEVPRWNRDGTELFYLGPGNMLMSVAVNTTGGSLTVGSPVGLFAVNIVSSGEGEYAVSSTGRFLLNTPSARMTETPVTVILNWAAGLRK